MPRRRNGCLRNWVEVGRTKVFQHRSGVYEIQLVPGVGHVAFSLRQGWRVIIVLPEDGYLTWVGAALALETAYGVV